MVVTNIQTELDERTACPLCRQESAELTPVEKMFNEQRRLQHFERSPQFRSGRCVQGAGEHSEKSRHSEKVRTGS